MPYLDFVEKATKQDQRNQFCEYHGVSDFIPRSLKDFLLSYNPLDVEIRLNDYSQIKLYPATELEALQYDYTLPDGSFCFATNNGDPIFIMDDKIYTMAHGGGTQYEHLADNFDEYLETLIERME
jgi:hypothetical protein